jgi:2-keto-3-deoxy-L-fuconate dehydrogenase
MTELRDKTVVVTAAGAGIGRASAERFARAGARVVAVDIDSAALATLANCETRRLDLRRASDIENLARELGRVHGLFNCAGFVHAGTILDSKEEEWDAAFDLNVKAMYRTIKAFLPAMLEAGSGAIVNMSSVAGAVIGVPNRLIYNATKAAVVGLTKGVAADFVKRGIRCNAICPGTVDTPSLDSRVRAMGDYETSKAAIIARQPMGRLGRPDEIAELALYLMSDASAFTTGQIHVIDGGWTA